MIRLILMAIIAYLIYRVVRSIVRQIYGSSMSRHGSSGTFRGEELVKDPYCDTYIPRSDAIEKKIGNETFYFCSRECMEGFIGERDKER